MFGKNPLRPPEKGDGSILQVQNIFPTLQGEGPFAGRPAIFIRLGGCNLACDFCDTEFEDFTTWTTEDVVAHASLYPARLAVITGGEPFRQPIAPLCEMLLAAGFEVQIETNGTLYRPLDSRIHIVCSPKTTTGQYAPLRPDLLPHISALKFLVSASHPLYRDIPELGQHDYHIPVYVQPIDEYDEIKNANNVTLAKDLAMTHGYRLSLQLHKLLGIE
ncbi:MAG: 7-carboxy-7-deazaguanine synthase QueE [Rickettsiales bacterium]